MTGAALLAEIYGWFTEGFDTRGLQDAKGTARRAETSLLVDSFLTT
jgi:hypothetical protein